MASMGQYARVAEHEGEDVGMLSKERSSGRHEVIEQPRSTKWWKYAIGAVVIIALIIPVTLYTFSVMLDSRVAAGVRAGLQAGIDKAVADRPVPEAITTTYTSTYTTTLVSTSTVTQQAAATHAAGVDVSPNDHHEALAEEGSRITLSNGTEIEISNPYGGRRFEMHHCGSNADEARALGCSYDVMMQEWTPPECIDWSLSEKYLQQGKWTWYADSNAETVYNDYEIALGNHDVVYVDQSYHRHHCIFAWERLVRAIRTQRPMIQKLIDYDHFKHCRHNTLKTLDEGAEAVRGVVAPTGFTSCASYDVWIEDLPANKLTHAEHAERMLEELYKEL